MSDKNNNDYYVDRDDYKKEHANSLDYREDNFEDILNHDSISKEQDEFITPLEHENFANNAYSEINSAQAGQWQQGGKSNDHIHLLYQAQDLQKQLEQILTSPMPYQTSWQGSEWQNKKQKKPVRHRTILLKNAVFIITVCMLFSLGCGFGGGLLAQQFSNNNQGNTNGKVLYQSVVRTSAGGTGDEQTADNLSVAVIAALTANSIVEITTETVTTGNRMRQYISEGAGSGVIVTTDGYIVTNNHVIEDASKISVRLKNSKTYNATLVGTDAKTDIAVIKIDATDLHAAVMGDSNALVVGELAVAVGNPLGELGGTVTDGIISALDREITIDGESMRLLQTNAAINPGNSGGGLFNEKGELIGIVNAKSSGSDIEGLGFAIPINTAKTVIEQLMANGYVKGRVEVGFTLVDIADAQTAMMYRVQEFGVYVLKVTDGSSAQTAGFVSGDLILSVDGKEINDSTDFSKVLDEHTVNDTVSVIVSRNRTQQTLSLVLTEYVPS